MKLYYIKTLFVAILVIFTTTTYGETYSGTCGTNVNWSLDTSTGLLKITGTGEMTRSPWKSYNSSIKSVEIAEGVTSIGDYAFMGCSGLTSVTIPNSVTSIEEHAFYGCSGLTSVTIPNSVTSIGKWAFYGCSGLTGVYITDLKAWCNIDFYNSYSNPLYATKLYLNGALVRKLEIPEGVTVIKKYVFNELNIIRSVTIPNSVTSIGESAFNSCSGLTSVTIGSGVSEIGDDAFYGCSGLTSVTIPNSVTSIGDEAFYVCSGLTSVTIPNSVTSIGESAFDRCSGLTSVTIGSRVSEIGDDAFYYCSKLNSIYSLAEYPPLIYTNTFNYVDKSIPVYIPIGSISKYKSAEGWNEFTNFIESDFTGIEDSNISATEIKVIAGNGIDICNYYGKLQVISLAGQVVKETYVNGSTQITLPKGAYIIVTENKSQKVVL